MVTNTLPQPLEGNYFVAAYPPFSFWSDKKLVEYQRLLQKPPCSLTNKSLGLYIHIPFCTKRCHFCYYLSYADKSTTQKQIYLDALRREMSLYGQSPALKNRKIKFVYFGGGTPSLISVDQIHALFKDLTAAFNLTETAEITFECAPKTATATRLHALRECGVNRISLGIQQLNDDILQKNGRIHRCADIERAYHAIGKIGFENVNVDLIVGLVGETDDSFFNSLTQVIDMAPDSVTIYQLEIPRNTPLYRTLKDKSLEIIPPSWDTKRTRLNQAFECLEQAGYTIRSAYAAVKDPSRHQFLYQDIQYHGADLIGLGVAAFSYFNGTHQQNRASFQDYLAALQNDTLPLGRAYPLSKKEQCLREFILQLKLGTVHLNDLQKKYGVELNDHCCEKLACFENKGWLKRNNHAVTLTRQGLLRIDSLLPEFYLPEHTSTPLTGHPL